MQKLIVFLVFLTACSAPITSNKPIVAVSIAPIGYIVEQLVDSTFDVVITVPQTTSAETYEMTAKQMAQVADAEFYIATGLIDFEQNLSEKIQSVAPNTLYVNLSNGLPLLDGVCGHQHNHTDEHNHLIDPHIWLSPKLVKQMAANVAKLLGDNNPKQRDFYDKNLSKLLSSIDSVDLIVKQKFDSCQNKTFAIVHPSLTYFANDYNLEQIAIEEDGKEASVHKIKQITDKLKEKNIKKILYSKQDPNSTAMQVAKQIGAEIVEYDPLKKEWLDNIEYLSSVLCN